VIENGAETAWNISRHEDEAVGDREEDHADLDEVGPDHGTDAPERAVENGGGGRDENGRLDLPAEKRRHGQSRCVNQDRGTQ
jgi:hypothetical protein